MDGLRLNLASHLLHNKLEDRDGGLQSVEGDSEGVLAGSYSCVEPMLHKISR